MRVTASAPGKLVLLGEYAVLQGAPALVLAVDRRAHVSLVADGGGAWRIASPTLGCEARLQVHARGTAWCSPAPPELAWLAILFDRSGALRNAPGGHIELETDTFHFDQAGQRTKLGLGSSAALSVALLGALHAHARQPAPTLAECIDCHRAIQHGQGSGIDIAASLQGGLSRFQLDGEHARATPATLPAGLHWRCVFSGRPASTPALLSRVARWRERDAASHARHMHELATISSRGIAAVTGNDATAFLSAVRDYASALARFGEAAGADIMSRGHRAIAAIAADCGCVYKPCGAGGGDVGVTFAVEDGRLREFETRAARAGFPVIGLQADPAGLCVDANV